jgi:hypothetical protein
LLAAAGVAIDPLLSPAGRGGVGRRFDYRASPGIVDRVVGYSCSTCRDPEFPELERFIGAIVGPCWRSDPDSAVIQAVAIEAALRSGYCRRHAVWLGELVGLTLRQDAARRDVLARAVVARPEGR